MIPRKLSACGYQPEGNTFDCGAREDASIHDSQLLCPYELEGLGCPATHHPFVPRLTPAMVVFDSIVQDHPDYSFAQALEALMQEATR